MEILKKEYITGDRNILQKVFDKYSRLLSWHPYYLSTNLGLTLDIVNRYRGDLFINSLVYNSSIPFDYANKIVKNDPFAEIPYNVCRRIDVTVEMLESINYPLHFHGLSFNPNITIEVLDRYIDRPWSWDFISSNSALTVEILLKYRDKPWNIESVCANPSITLEMIEQYNLPINFIGLSRNPSLTLDFILKHINEDWNFSSISEHIHLTFDIVEKLEKYLDLYYLSLNPSLTIEIVDICFKKFKDTLNWYGISKNPSITIEMVISRPYLPWVIEALSKNPSITMDIVETYTNIEWCDKGLCLNPNLTLKAIEKRKLYRYLHRISENPFLFDDTLFNRHITRDFKSRREKVLESVDIVEDIKKYILKFYIGYH